MQEEEKQGETKVQESVEIASTADFKENCFGLRELVEELKKATKLVLKKHPVFNHEQVSVGQIDEMKANLKLAYRHLEDARMRLGKAIQAYD